MKKAVLTILLTLFAIGAASAQRTVSLRQGDQTLVGGRLNINFLEVTDDSRCPIGTTCIWAGNAKVKLALSIGKTKAQEFDLNSDTKPTSIEYGGYRIRFVSLTRRPTKPGAMTSVRPKLVVSVKKLRRH
ncbi:MAG: hypothetical protein JO314_07500 [Acidobacteria bacterium]|nr:hypothetical protein [Acidobacteriota bacterium]